MIETTAAMLLLWLSRDDEPSGHAIRDFGTGPTLRGENSWGRPWGDELSLDSEFEVSLIPFPRHGKRLAAEAFEREFRNQFEAASNTLLPDRYKVDRIRMKNGGETGAVALSTAVKPGDKISVAVDGDLRLRTSR